MENKPLRLWPGIVLAILVLALRYGTPVVAPDELKFGMLGSLACSLLIGLWWLLFSRAPWVERGAAVILIAVGMFGARAMADRSIVTGGMGFLYYLLAVPLVSVALVAWAVATRGLGTGARRLTMAGVVLAACGIWALVRTGGFTGDFQNDLHWRWEKTPEERLLAQQASLPVAAPAAEATPTGKAPGAAAPASTGPVEKAPAEKGPEKAEPEKPVEAVGKEPAGAGPEWQGFRGAARNGVATGVRIRTDWGQKPPESMWKRAVGPGWSSFAVKGKLIYTQEQRGPEEVVACYRLETGEPVWAHKDEARFWESNGGPGPRGTPTLDGDRVYTFGATGILNALRASDGKKLWSRKAATELGVKTPDWGFSSSPLVVGEEVIVAVSGRLVAYDAKTGEQKWTGPESGASYSSPQLARIGGTEQVVQLGSKGAFGVGLEDGKLLWEHAWKGYPIVQPGLTPEGDVLLSVGDSSGLRRLAVVHGDGGWKAEERWTSMGLKPYFNDFVVHKGYAFGFDGNILSCIDLKDGKRKWKGGRYGNGQMVLLADQDVLVVLSEQGEVVLVGATPEQFTEMGRIPAIEGKTWNHPVVAGDVLLVRNGEEMAAFRLAREGT